MVGSIEEDTTVVEITDDNTVVEDTADDAVDDELAENEATEGVVLVAAEVAASDAEELVGIVVLEATSAVDVFAATSDAPTTAVDDTKTAEDEAENALTVFGLDTAL